MSTITETNTVNIVYKEGEEKPWRIEYDDVNVLQTARAAINYPVTRFDTEEQAIEVATMIRDIIHADAVDVTGEEGERELLDDTAKAPFFKVIHGEEKHETPENDAVDETREDTVNTENVEKENPNLMEPEPLGNNPINPPEHITQEPYAPQPPRQT